MKQTIWFKASTPIGNHVTAHCVKSSVVSLKLKTAFVFSVPMDNVLITLPNMKTSECRAEPNGPSYHMDSSSVDRARVAWRTTPPRGPQHELQRTRLQPTGSPPLGSYTKNPTSRLRTRHQGSHGGLAAVTPHPAHQGVKNTGNSGASNAR